MENCLLTVDLRFSMVMLVYQSNNHFPMVFPRFSYDFPMQTSVFIDDLVSKSIEQTPDPKVDPLLSGAQETSTAANITGPGPLGHPFSTAIHLESQPRNIIKHPQGLMGLMMIYGVFMGLICVFNGFNDGNHNN